MQNKTKSVEEKNKRTNTGLGQLQVQEGGSLGDTFMQLSVDLRKTSTKPLTMLTSSYIG